MLVDVFVGAVVSLVLLVFLLGFVIRRAPQLFVADRLAAKLHDHSDGDGIDESGLDSGETYDYE